MKCDDHHEVESPAEFATLRVHEEVTECIL